MSCISAHAAIFTEILQLLP